MGFVIHSNSNPYTCPKCTELDEFCFKCNTFFCLGACVKNEPPLDILKFQNCLMWYCTGCRFLFQVSHTHAVNGCENDYMYYKVPTKYSFNGNIYNGTPELLELSKYLRNVN